jgi:outer membrane protein, multidrug efflux system
MKRFILLAGSALLLAGCTLIPDYRRPDAPIPSQYPSGQAYGHSQAGSAKTAVDLVWHDFFCDPVISDLVSIALDQSRDLRVATEQVTAMRAQFFSQRADLFPTVDMGAGATVVRQPAGILQVPGLNRPIYTRDYQLGLGVSSYEVDLFGQVRSLTRRAFEQYLGQEDNRRAVQIALIGSVATAYLGWLADNQSLAITNDTVKSRQESLDLIRHMMTAGVGTDRDVAEAEMALNEAQVNQQRFTRNQAQDLNQLALLLGTEVPADLLGRMQQEGTLDAVAPFPDVPAGLPSSLLERRPDILEAEHVLLATNANIGAARAAFFPTILLTGSGGTAADSITSLFSPGTAAWTLAPQVTVPIFDAGRNSANLSRAKAENREAVARYEKAIQTAFRETADALAGKGTYTAQLQAQTGLVASSARDYHLSEARFRSGADNYLNTLVAQRSLYSSQIDLITTRLEELSNRVILYKVLGGGWQEHAGRDGGGAKNPSPERQNHG